MRKRKPAVKMLVSDILTGMYVKRPGWEPSGILTPYGEASRVDLIGIIVSISREGETSFLLDDGSGNIEIRFFGENDASEDLSLGEMVRVIGKPREWGSTKYIVPEIVRKISDNRWYELHHLQVKLQRANSMNLPVEIHKGDTDYIEIGPYQKLLNTIAMLDKGGGIDIQNIVEVMKIKDCEKFIRELIAEGEIFEISPGKVKILA